jgi:hypothetical protein
MVAMLLLHVSIHHGMSFEVILLIMPCCALMHQCWTVIWVLHK